MKIKPFKTRKIVPRSIGAKIKAARKRKKASLSIVEEQTKIQEKFLQAIEEDNFSALPAEVYSIGYITKYLEFLNMKSSLIEDFRKEFNVWRQKESQLMVANRIKEPRMILTPKIIIGFFSFLAVSIIVGYIYLQIRTLTSPPNLEIILPNGKEVVQIDVIEIIGKVDQNAKIVINNEAVALQGNGEFTQKVKLSDGINNIQITAENRFNKKTVKNLQILKSRGETNVKI